MLSQTQIESAQRRLSIGARHHNPNLDSAIPAGIVTSGIGKKLLNRPDERMYRHYPVTRIAGGTTEGSAGPLMPVYGYPVFYRTNSQPMFFDYDYDEDRVIYFFEQFDPNAFIDSLREDDQVLTAINHDMDRISACTNNGTLRFSDSDSALSFEADMNDTSYSRDMYQCLKRGDVRQLSFTFRLSDPKNDQLWMRDDATGNYMRTIKRAKLSEVTYTPMPAYTNTVGGTRSMPEDNPNELLRELRIEIQRLRAQMIQIEAANSLEKLERLKSI